jgi:hypothetical protein
MNHSWRSFSRQSLYIYAYHESKNNKRIETTKSHPTLCGPWDTAASMLRSLSISEDSAYGIHGYTPPILEKLESCQPPLEDVLGTRDILSGQSSPGTLQVGQHPSKGTRHIPHTSSSGSPFSSVLPVSHCHWAIACHCLTMTFMVVRKTRLFVLMYATRLRRCRSEDLLGLT